VLYGTVPELARKGEISRAFALFYTGLIGAGGLAPIAYGAIADHSSRTIGVLAAAGRHYPNGSRPGPFSTGSASRTGQIDDGREANISTLDFSERAKRASRLRWSIECAPTPQLPAFEARNVRHARF
jgi:hypothetical protein